MYFNKKENVWDVRLQKVEKMAVSSSHFAEPEFLWRKAFYTETKLKLWTTSLSSINSMWTTVQEHVL